MTSPMPSQLTYLLNLARKLPSDEGAAKRRARFRRFHVLSALGAVASAVSLAAVLMRDKSPGAEAPDELLLCLAAALILFFTLGSICADVVKACTPLSQSSLCTDALVLVKRSAWAREIRDAAITSGRQLHLRDYELMTEAASREDWACAAERARQLQRQACTELHSSGPSASPSN
jgi:hypothetical protein